MVQKKVLVIEDDPGMLTILRIRLKHEGLDVVPARSEKEALQYLETQHPDISLMDSYFPVADEEGFIEKLQDKTGKPVVVFIFRGEPGDSNLEHLANVFIPLPFDVEKVAKRVGKLCGIDRPRSV